MEAMLKFKTNFHFNLISIEICDLIQILDKMLYLMNSYLKMSTNIFIRSHLAFQIFSVCAFGILLWLRIDWGFEEWLHEAYFYNFWHGVYFLLSGRTWAKTENYTSGHPAQCHLDQAHSSSYP